MEEKKDQNIGDVSMKNIEKLSKKLKGKTGLAVLSYLGLFSIIPLLTSKDEFVKFHAKQGFILFLLELVTTVILVIPMFNAILILTWIILSVLGIKAVIDKKKWEIPYIYDWSKKIKI